MKSPGPRCSICDHPRRADIDADRRSVTRAAKAWGISKSTLDRHRKHAAAVPLPSTTPSEPPPPLTPTSELEAVEKGLARIVQLMAKAEGEDVPRLVKGLSDLRRARDELLKRRELTEGDILASEAWKRLRGRFAEALKPFPEAARALASACGAGSAS